METGYLIDRLPLRQRTVHRGAQVAWDVIGSGTPVVLLHGFPWSSQVWRRVAPALAREYRVYYVDLLGFGESSIPEDGDVSPAAQDRLLADLIAGWDLRSPYVVGHDFGGLAALRGILERDLCFSGLTLIDSVGLLPSGSPFWTHARAHIDAFRDLPSYMHHAVVSAFLQNGVRSPLSESVLDLYLTPWRGTDGAHRFYDQILQSTAVPLEAIQDRLDQLPIRPHVIWGTHDHNIPISHGRDLARRVNARSFTEIEHAAHLVPEDSPEDVVSLVSSHLRAETC
ncbi:alpha/beta hydrolase [Curtobacterium flaccumfaciens]|nr:alpha/beta hydrolase [Curtobacterium flaccumfaciens]